MIMLTWARILWTFRVQMLKAVCPAFNFFEESYIICLSNARDPKTFMIWNDGFSKHTTSRKWWNMGCLAATCNSYMIYSVRITDALKYHRLPCWHHGMGNRNSEKTGRSICTSHLSLQHVPLSFWCSFVSLRQLWSWWKFVKSCWSPYGESLGIFFD